MERIFTYGKGVFGPIAVLKSGIQLSLKDGGSLYIPMRGIAFLEIQNTKDLIFEINGGRTIKIEGYPSAGRDFNKLMAHFENWKTFTG